jgi:hypothetical protein
MGEIKEITMNVFGFSTVIQIINLILLISWIVLAIIAIINLSGKKLPATPKALWALIILCIPVLGAVAFFIVKPEENEN